MGVSVALVRSVVEMVTRSGVDAEALVQDVGLDPEVLADAEARVANRQFDHLLGRALERTGDLAFGLHMGEQTSLACFDVVGYLAYHAQTAREGLHVFLRYFRIVCDLEPPELIEQGDTALLVCHFPRTNPACDRARAEFCFARLATLAATSLGMASHAREVHFQHAAPSYVAEYRRVFGPNIDFDKPNYRIVIPREILDRPLLHGDPQLYRALEEQADRRLRTLREPDSVSMRLQELVLERHGQLECDMESLARQLGMSARTLRRRLVQEGRSFGDVLGAALATVAKRMLREPRVSIQEVSYQMGFADASSFHRAFKRWTGVTPKQYQTSL